VSLLVIHPSGGRRREIAAGERVAVSAGEAALVTAIGAAPDGEVLLDGRSIARWSPARRARHGVVAVVDAPVAADVAVRDHLAARVTVARATALVDACPLLAGRGDEPAGVLSGGERRALAWLRADALDPRVVVLADAETGLDPATRAWTAGLVARWRERGAAVLDA
jgi:branched-chain amino acid transport system ATP-binding protein